MGVNGLWKLVDPAKMPRTISEISMDYWRKNDSEFRGLRVGIDTSMVMIMAMDEAQAESNLCPTSPLDPTVLALRLLFNFLSSLFNVPTLLPLFVFDGKDRPKRKRGRNICTSEFVIEAEVRSLCDAFGFPWRMAPGEAEWEMADLAKYGYIDACWTGDSDIFLALPPLIFRLPLTFQALLATVSPTPTLLQTYSSRTLLALPTPLSPPTFLFLATLIGGDYARGPLPPLLLDVPPSCTTRYSRKGLSILATLVRLSIKPYPPLPGTTFATSLVLSLASDSLLEEWSARTRAALRDALPAELHISSHSAWPSRPALNLYLSPLTTSSLTNSSLPSDPRSSTSSPSPHLRQIARTPPSIPKLIDAALDTLLLLPSDIERSFLRPEGLLDGFVRLHFHRSSHRIGCKKGREVGVASNDGDEVGFIGAISASKNGKLRIAIGVRAWVEETREGLRRAVGEGGARGTEEWGRAVWVDQELLRAEVAEWKEELEKEETGEKRKGREARQRGWMESGFVTPKKSGGLRKESGKKGAGKVVARKVVAKKFSPIAVIVLE